MLFESTRAVMFFATPHQGLDVDALLEIVQDESRGPFSKTEFIQQLRESSNFLNTQRENITNIPGLADHRGDSFGGAAVFREEKDGSFRVSAIKLSGHPNHGGSGGSGAHLLSEAEEFRIAVFKFPGLPDHRDYDSDCVDV